MVKTSPKVDSNVGIRSSVIFQIISKKLLRQTFRKIRTFRVYLERIHRDGKILARFEFLVHQVKNGQNWSFFRF